MLLSGMLIQWVHGFDELFLFIAHGAGALATRFGLWLIVRKASREKWENP